MKLAGTTQNQHKTIMEYLIRLKSEVLMTVSFYAQAAASIYNQ